MCPLALQAWPYADGIHIQMPIGDIPSVGCPVSSLPHHIFTKAQMNSKLNPRKDTIFRQKFSSSFSWFVFLYHDYVLSALKQTTPRANARKTTIPENGLSCNPFLWRSHVFLKDVSGRVISLYEPRV